MVFSSNRFKGIDFVLWGKPDIKSLSLIKWFGCDHKASSMKFQITTPIPVAVSNYNLFAKGNFCLWYIRIQLWILIFIIKKGRISWLPGYREIPDTGVFSQYEYQDEKCHTAQHYSCFLFNLPDERPCGRDISNSNYVASRWWMPSEHSALLSLERSQWCADLNK